MSVSELYDLITRGGLPVVALLILWAGFRGYWVWGRELTKAEQRADKFEQLAMGNLHLAATAADALGTERTRGTGV